MTVPIDIAVVREAKTWRIRYGAVELDYSMQAEALADAIAIARAFGKEGQFSSVRMGVMTSVYGPDGFIRAVPSAKLSTPSTSIKPEDVRADSAPKKAVTRQTTPKALDERGRITRIASAFEVVRDRPA